MQHDMQKPCRATDMSKTNIGQVKEIMLPDDGIEDRVCCTYLEKPVLQTKKIVEVPDMGHVEMEGRCGKWKDT